MSPDQLRTMLEKTGGSAFPSERTVEGGGTLTMTGMSLRDYFASMALMGMNVYSGMTLEGRSSSADETDRLRAESAYRQADAMLAERTK